MAHQVPAAGRGSVGSRTKCFPSESSPRVARKRNVHRRSQAGVPSRIPTVETTEVLMSVSRAPPGTANERLQGRVLPPQMLGDPLHRHTRPAHLPDRRLVFLPEPDHHHTSRSTTAMLRQSATCCVDRLRTQHFEDIGRDVHWDMGWAATAATSGIRPARSSTGGWMSPAFGVGLLTGRRPGGRLGLLERGARWRGT